MIREIGGARNLAWWRAWYDLEPRGEDRSDWHAALLALLTGKLKEGMALDDVLNMMRDCWYPPTREEKELRKVIRKKRNRKKWQAHNRKIMQEDQERERQRESRRKVGKNGQLESRQVERSGEH